MTMRTPTHAGLALLVLAALAAAARPARADLTLEDLADQMAQMQAEMADLRRLVETQNATIDAQAAMLDERDLMSVSGEGSVASGGYPNTTIGGYVDVEFANFDRADSDINQHRFIVNLSSQLHERVNFYSEIELEEGADTGAGGGAVEVEQAYVDFELYPWLVFRAGALLVPFSRYNLLHDSDLNDLTSRPLYARRIVPTTWTEAGAGFTGDIALPHDMALNYEAYVINGLDDGISDVGTRGARPALRRDNNNDKGFVGRAALSPTPWATIGAYGYEGRWTSSNGLIPPVPGADPSRGFGDETATGYGFDLFLHHGPWEFIGEYGMFDFDGAGKLGPVGPGVMLDGDMHGGYAQLAYHFWPSFLDPTPFGDGFEDPTFTFVGRYDFAEIELAGVDDNREDRWTLGFNYRPIEALVFKAEWQWSDHDGAGRALENGGQQGILASAAWAF